MSEPKHTPGPWEVFESDDSPYSREIMWNGSYVATAYGFSQGDEDGEANARLIAAAPCLLARLESMAAQHACGCWHPACKRCADDKLNQEVIERAKGGAE